MAYNSFYYDILDNINIGISLQSIVSLKQIDIFNTEIIRESRVKGKCDDLIPILIPGITGSLCILKVKPPRESVIFNCNCQGLNDTRVSLNSMQDKDDTNIILPIFPQSPVKISFNSSLDPITIQYHLLLADNECLSEREGLGSEGILNRNSIIAFSVRNEMKYTENFTTILKWKNVIEDIDFLVTPIRTTLGKYRYSFLNSYQRGYKNLWPLSTLVLKNFWNWDLNIPTFIHPKFDQHEFSL